MNRDTIRVVRIFSFKCLEQLLLAEKPIFFTGGSGVGKSAVIANKLT